MTPRSWQLSPDSHVAVEKPKAATSSPVKTLTTDNAKLSKANTVPLWGVANAWSRIFRPGVLSFCRLKQPDIGEWIILAGLFGINGVNLKAQLSPREEFRLVENVPFVEPDTSAEMPGNPGRTAHCMLGWPSARSEAGRWGDAASATIGA